MCVYTFFDELSSYVVYMLVSGSFERTTSLALYLVSGTSKIQFTNSLRTESTRESGLYEEVEDTRYSAFPPLLFSLSDKL